MKLNPQHQPGAYRPVFERHGRLHIPEVLTPSTARALHQTLTSDLPWTRSIHVSVGEDMDIPVAELDALSADQRAEFERSLTDASSDSLQYIFDRVSVSRRVQTGADLSADLIALHDFINGPAVREFVAQATGRGPLAFADVMATRYAPGHFLTAHGDENPSERRAMAYVLNLTPAWRADWGGVLMFLDDDGHVAEGYTPAFNALNLFSVPQTHAVSMVTRLAQTSRLSVTGWFHAG